MTSSHHPSRTSALLHVALVVVALALWSWSVSGVDLDRLGGLGLAPLLPVPYYASLLLVIVSFGLLLRSEGSPLWLPLIHYIALALIWHATPALIYDLPRYSYTYKHIGIIDNIERNWSIDPTIDAYFNWPGFFSLNAFGHAILGGNHSWQLAKWAPFLFNLMYIGPLLVLYRALSDHRRLVLIGVWIFMLTSWVGQDYFAPQALAFFFHLTFLAVYVTWFRTPKTWASEEVEAPATNASQRVGLVLILVLMYVYLVAGHQLTPIFTLLSVATLVLFGRTRLRLLPLLMLALQLAWFAYPAATFMAGTLGDLVDTVGALLTNFSVSVSSGPLVETEFGMIVSIRRGLSLSLWGLAFFGALRRFLSGRRDLTAGLLLLVPFPMIALGSYGGEMLLRIYLFALPLAAWFVGAFLIPKARVTAPRWLAARIIGLSVVLAAANVFAYYGYELFNHVPAQEIAAFDSVYREAPTGSMIVTISGDAPSKFRRYGEIDYEPLLYVRDFDPTEPVDRQLQALIESMSWEQYAAAYVVLTRSEAAHALASGLIPATVIERLEDSLANSTRFSRTYSTSDASVFRLVAEEDDLP